ncbi:MAG: hypothetical protein JNM69_16035 [Archangium sp.]|nr:hypothetical protein [Archangium sp.]
MDALQKYRRFILPGLLVATIAAWVLTPTTRAKPIHGPCLVHADCHGSERCLVKPASDGFATMGECVDPCEGDLQCPAQQRCGQFVEAGQYWTLPSSGKGRGAPVGACLPGARSDG